MACFNRVHGIRFEATRCYELHRVPLLSHFVLFSWIVIVFRLPRYGRLLHRFIHSPVDGSEGFRKSGWGDPSRFDELDDNFLGGPQNLFILIHFFHSWLLASGLFIITNTGDKISIQSDGALRHDPKESSTALFGDPVSEFRLLTSGFSLSISRSEKMVKMNAKRHSSCMVFAVPFSHCDLFSFWLLW